MNTHSLAFIGAMIGLVAAVLDNLMLNWILARPAIASRPVDHPRVRALVRALFIVFPVIGWMIGTVLGR